MIVKTKCPIYKCSCTRLNLPQSTACGSITRTEASANRVSQAGHSFPKFRWACWISSFSLTSKWHYKHSGHRISQVLKCMYILPIFFKHIKACVDACAQNTLGASVFFTLTASTPRLELTRLDYRRWYSFK